MMRSRRTPGRGAALCALLCAALIGASLAGCATTSQGGSDSADAARINVQLGVDYLKQGNLALAQTKLMRALDEDSHLAEVHGALALLDERLGKVKDADREYRRALRLSNDSPAMQNNYAVYLCSHGRPDEGVGYFEKAASNPLYQTPWAAFTNAGVCLHSVHRDAEAMQRFVQAMQSNPHYADAVFQASNLDFLQQHYALARARIDAYLKGNSATADLLLLGWRVAGAQQDVIARRGYAERLQRQFPGSVQARAVELATARSSG